MAEMDSTVNTTTRYPMKSISMVSQNPAYRGREGGREGGREINDAIGSLDFNRDHTLKTTPTHLTCPRTKPIRRNKMTQTMERQQGMVTPKIILSFFSVAAKKELVTLLHPFTVLPYSWVVAVEQYSNNPSHTGTQFTHR